MATNVLTRVERLEAAVSGGECPRCSGVVVVWFDGEFSGASKHGSQMTKAEYRAFKDEELVEGVCPRCGEQAREIVVGSPDWGTANPG